MKMPFQNGDLALRVRADGTTRDLGSPIPPPLLHTKEAMDKKPVKYERRMGVLDLLMSSVLDRSGAMDHLLMERPSPPYILTSLVAIVAVLVLPALYYHHAYSVTSVDKTLAYAIIITLVLTLVLFTLCTTVLLRLMGISAPVVKVIGAITYSLVATIPLMLTYYAANFAINGELTILGFFTTGRLAEGEWLIGLFPTLLYIAAALMFLVFVSALRALGNTPISSAYLMAVLCLPLLIGSFFVGMTCAESLFPQSAFHVGRFFSSFLDVPTQ